MQAHVYRRYGGPEVVELAEVEKPVPGAGEILVAIRATTVTSADWRVRTLTVPKGFGPLARLMFGVVRPRQPILGTELAGVIEAVDAAVTRFRPGDAVMAFPGEKMGCHARYRVLREDGPVVKKPENLSFEEAVALPFGGTTALHFMRKAGLKPGEKILVVGASGNVGTALVQLARHAGAAVTGVTSTGNAELVASLGAGRVIDYTAEDFATVGETWDVVADTTGTVSFARCRPALRDGGRMLSIAGGLSEMLAALRVPGKDGKRVIAGVAEERPEDVARLAELAGTGALRPVIDRIYDFTEMREAHAHVATGRKRGSVVVRVAHGE